MRQRHAWPWEAVVAALAGSLVGAALVGAHGDPGLTLHACHRPNDVIRLVTLDGGENPCEPNEVLEEWSVQGQSDNDGARGARGPVGPEGAAGPAGADGRDGPQYAFGISSARGGHSVTARCAAGEIAVGGGWSARPGVTVTGSGRSAPGAWTIEGRGPAQRVRRLLRETASSVSAYAVCARAVAR